MFLRTYSFLLMALSMLFVCSFSTTTFAQTYDMTGQHTGNTNAVLSMCVDPDDNGPLVITSTVFQLSTPSGGNSLTGSLTLTALVKGQSIPALFALTGTASASSPQRTLSGTMISLTPGILIGNGTFTGTWTRNVAGQTDTLTVNMSGQGSTSEGTCSYTASTSGIGPEGIEVTHIPVANMPDANTYVIDATPLMPTIQARAKVRNITPDPTSGTLLRG